MVSRASCRAPVDGSLQVLVNVVPAPELLAAHSMQVAVGISATSPTTPTEPRAAGYVQMSILGDSDAVLGPPEWAPRLRAGLLGRRDRGGTRAARY